ncbi:type VI secretion system-associated protein TagF [Massilia aerilata]|uniref:Type VI secretion system-associated protein TagF n=1 Tax=Massilia aerilata TaxID=453817 RepID=A0ABW0RZ01_9BURK
MSSGLVGFFGKLPSHGDFVGRRLPPAVKDCFDRWLQAGLVRSKEDLGDEWLPVWLSSPIWRFVVAAGVCGEQAWAGVMMPSHDRVGRCFPLLLMAGIDGTPSMRACLTVHDGWFARLEALALSTLEEGFALDSFDAALLALMPFATALRPADGDAVPAPADADLAGRSAWWTIGSPLVTACLAMCGGLPPAAAFISLLDGRWTDRNCASVEVDALGAGLGLGLL